MCFFPKHVCVKEGIFFSSSELEEKVKMRYVYNFELFKFFDSSVSTVNNKIQNFSMRENTTFWDCLTGIWSCIE